ncbi:MAG: hypothetical protein RL477_52 [Pseudomonadota bacterium]
MSAIVDDIAALRARARAANVNPQSLLATDYLNHFNEAMMLLELVPDMPECIEDLADWTPVSYEDHFRHSAFSGRDVAIEAYRAAPAAYRKPFDATVAKLNALLEATIAGASRMAARGDMAAVAAIVRFAMPSIRTFQEKAGAIINGAVIADVETTKVEDAEGGEYTLDQSEIDSLMKT